MIKGIITDDLEPIVPLELIFNDDVVPQVAIVDTGFNGYLSIPRKLIPFSWQFKGYEKYEIADGEIIRSEVYIGEIIFDSEKYKVGVLASRSKEILLGTQLLKDKKLFINFKEKTLWIKNL